MQLVSFAPPLLLCEKPRSNLRHSKFLLPRLPDARMCVAQPDLPPALIDLHGIRYTLPMDFTKKLFRNTDLSIRQNEFVVITGENGAGKSTRMSVTGQHFNSNAYP
jgi:ATPase subunit of ABC transporter with duplicated ATPase domains